MRSIILAAMLAAVTKPTSAGDIAITCKVSSGTEYITTFSPKSFSFSDKSDLGAPRNFIISADGLETPWGKECAKAEVSAERASVNCAGDYNSGTVSFSWKKIVDINRRLGTYSEIDTLTDANAESSTHYSGTCEKREMF